MTGHLNQQLTGTFEALSKMKAFSPDGRDAKAQRDRLATELGQQKDWVLANARHHAMRARTRQAAQEVLAEAAEAAPRIDDLAARVDDINREVDARKDVVSAMRQAAGEEASKDLSRFFKNRAVERGKTALAWALGLVGMIGITALVALIAYWELGPDRGASDPAAFTALGLAALLVGLCLFGIRICAQQYRVNRHLEAVAQTKATALSTFTPLSSSIEDADVRTAIAAALAQAVFETENTGLIDSSADHVTIVERALLSRAARPGSTESSS